MRCQPMLSVVSSSVVTTNEIQSQNTSGLVSRLNRMGASEKSDPVATKTTSNALPGANLLPCGSIQVPQLDHLAEAQGLTVRAVQEKCRLMINCIRFGSVAGKQRAIVAGQNGAIYVFELPPPPSPSQDPPAVRLYFIN